MEKEIQDAENSGKVALINFAYTNNNEIRNHVIIGKKKKKGNFSVVINGNQYQFDHRVLTYDPRAGGNSQTIKNSALYYSDTQWAIPFYSAISSTNKVEMQSVDDTARLKSIVTDIDYINLVDYRTGEASFSSNWILDTVWLVTSKHDYIIESSSEVDEVENQLFNGTSSHSDSGSIIIGTALADNNGTSFPYKIALPNVDGTYTITSDTESVDFSMMYQDYYLSSASNKTGSVYFTPEGKVSLKTDEIGNSFISLTANDGYYTLPWSTVEISGNDIQEISAEWIEDGVLITSDNFENVTVIGKHDDEVKEISFSTNQDKVLIAEEDNTLIALIDTDNDGIYDTDINDMEDHSHAYGSPTFEWSKDYKSCVAVFTCKDGDDVQRIDCEVTSDTTDPTCMEDGKAVYTAKVSFVGAEFTETKEEVLPAIGHSYEYKDNGDGTHTKACSSCDISEAEVHTYEEGTCKYCKAEEPKEHSHSYSSPEFEWSEDYQSCTAVFTCKDGDDVQRIDCEVTSEITDATCTEDGKTVYAATVNFAGATFTDEQTEIINATGHTYNKAEFEWSEDYQSCMAVINCKDGDDVKRIDCEVTSETTDATCTEDGTTVYTATVSFEGEVYTDTKKEAIPAGGHTYKYVDNGDDTHTKTCTVCDTRETENHTYEDGICKYCKAEEPKVHSHEYGKPKFEWSKDYQSCTAIFSCKNGDDEQRIECEVSSKTTDPTCTEDGKTIYTATVSFGGAEFTDTKEESISSTGHIYEYADNGDGTHTKTCTICDASESEPHTYVDGICQYCKAEEPEEHSHEYGEPKFEWSKDNENCAAVFVCKDGDDKQQVECKVTSKILTEATCTEDGTVVYSATASFEGQEYTDTKEATIPATGHTYEYTDNGDGTHTKTCKICDTRETENHTYEDGICQYCKAEEPKEHSHEYGKPKFEWSKDNKKCTAVFTCKDGDDEQRVECEVTSKTTDPTCTKDGKIVYKAVVSFEGEEYTDTKEKKIEATGHTYEYQDNGDGTHKKVCTSCGKSITESHDYQKGVCKQCGAEEPNDNHHNDFWYYDFGKGIRRFLEKVVIPFWEKLFRIF